MSGSEFTLVARKHLEIRVSLGKLIFLYLMKECVRAAEKGSAAPDDGSINQPPRISLRMMLSHTGWLHFVSDFVIPICLPRK
ncbi:hypothetical protein TNCV_5055801 [Trichonephila clavipes]|nr:hypothetical protein TNCV_5055801 [Trichonephila clavipes]